MDDKNYPSYRGENNDSLFSGIFTRLRQLCLRLFADPKQRRLQRLRDTVPANLAEFFGCGELHLQQLAKSTADHYQKFFLWKDRAHTRKRWIEAPDPELKAMQRRILRLLYHLAPSPWAHGFIIGRGIVTNARPHSGRKFVIKLDLKDFFPSISRAMILEQLNASGIVTAENRARIQTLLDLCLLHDRLPQGAPTSPAISNLVCRRLDVILAKFARRHKMIYSRYADDLTFSCNSDHCYSLIPIIKTIVAHYGFKVNERKVNVLKQHQRQTVTGLVVNRTGTASIPRRHRMKLRAFLHQIISGEIPPDGFNFARLRGHVALICMANPRQGAYFRQQLELVAKLRKSS